MTAEELYNSIDGNYAEAKKRLMNDRLISKFIVKFLNDPSYDQFIAAWKEKNEEMLFRSSHTLKGVCANLALDKLYTLASDICEYYRPGKEAERAGKDVAALVMALEEQYALTVAAIKLFAEQ